MSAQHLNDSNFKSTLETSETPVMVDFFAEWCGPCQMAAPVIDKLADEYQGKMMIVKADVEEARQTAGEYGVMSIPTVIVFKKDESGAMVEIDRKIGFPGEDGYREMIESAL